MNYNFLNKKEYSEYKKEKLKLLEKAIKDEKNLTKQIRLPVVKNLQLKNEIRKEYIYYMWVLNQPEYYNLLEKRKETK